VGTFTWPPPETPNWPFDTVREPASLYTVSRPSIQRELKLSTSFAVRSRLRRLWLLRDAYGYCVLQARCEDDADEGKLFVLDGESREHRQRAT
jgi:hypothetical protein